VDPSTQKISGWSSRKLELVQHSHTLIALAKQLSQTSDHCSAQEQLQDSLPAPADRTQISDAGINWGSLTARAPIIPGTFDEIALAGRFEHEPLQDDSVYYEDDMDAFGAG
jgi:hypothetical protein